MEFGPSSPQLVGNSSDPYNCGNPGGLSALSGYGSCSWEFKPPRLEFQWVRAGGKACTSDAECTAKGEICGMADNGHVGCGELLGYWSHDQFCGQNLGLVYPYAHCDAKLPYPNEGQTLWNLLGCVDVPSCYQDNSGINCCGCVDWQNEISAVSPDTLKCKYENPNWLAYVKPYLQYLKEACPSAYTFPYDDHSSTYVCSYIPDGSSTNTMNYTLTFCPDGK
jgi:hypothetical protein